MTSPALPPLRGTATLDNAPFRKGAQEVLTDLRAIQELAKKVGTIRITSDLSSARKVKSEFDDLRGKVGKPIEVPITTTGRGKKELGEVDAAIQHLAGTVRATRNLWQTQIITDKQAAASAERLRDKLLQLAAAEEAGADAVVKATQAAASAQRTLDAARGTLTKGGFAASASIGILDALTRLNGPVGAAAAGLGQMINSGLLSGLRAGKPQVGKGAEDIGEAVIGSLKNKLQIRSPSRVTTQFGQFAAEGLAAGMKSGQGQVAKAGFDLGKSAENGISAGLKGGNFGQKLSESLRVSGGAFGGVAREAQNGTATLGKFALGVEAVQFAAGAATAVLIGLGTAIAVSVATAADFEKAMDAVQAVTQATTQEFEALKQQARDLAADSSFNLAQIAGAQEELAKAGINTADILGGATKGVSLLAEATGTDLKTAAEIGAKALNIFGLEGSDLVRVADIISSGANKTALDVQTLGSALGQVGAAASNAGLDLGETTALLGAFADRGIEGSDAGTSLKTALERLTAPTEKTTAALKAYNIEVFDSQGKQRDMIEVFQDVIGAMDTMTDQQRAAFLQTVFGTDATRAATIAWKAGAKGIDEYVASVNDLGAAERNAQTRKDNLRGALEQLGGAYDNLKETVGAVFLPVLTKTVRAVTQGVEGFNALLNSGERLASYLPTVATALTGVGAAILYVKRAQVGLVLMNAWTALAAFPGGAAAAITTKLIPAIGAAATASAAFIAANPWLLVIAAVTATGVAVVKLSTDIKNTYDSIDESSAASSKMLVDKATELRKAGDELSLAQARTLAALNEMSQAQAGRRTARTFWTGEYEVDEEAVRRTTAAYQAARAELDRVRAAQQARAQATGQATTATQGDTAATQLTVEQLEEQRKAVADLDAELGKRRGDVAFQLKLEGKSDLQRDLLEVGRSFDDLRAKARAAFGGQDGPELAGRLAQITELQEQEQAAVRRRYAAERAKERREEAQAAAKSARDYAVEVQRAEVEAMREGVGKVRAQRQLDLADLQRSIREKVEAAKGFPAEQRRIEELGRRALVALREKWRGEDLARQQEATEQRRQELEEQARELAQAAQQAAESVRGATLDARRAEIEAMGEGAGKLRAQRQLELDELVRGINEKIAALEGFPAEQARIYAEGQRQVNATLARYRREDAEAGREAAKEQAETERKASEDRRKRAEDDARAAREAASRIAQAWQQATEAQATARLAGLNEQAAQYELTLSRNLAAVRGNAEAVTRLEAQATRDRAAHAERVAVEQYNAERQRLDYALAQALAAEDLSAGQRRALRVGHLAQVQALDRKYHADELGRIAAREEAERQAAEKIRLARIKTAEQPLQEAQGELAALSRAQQLADSTAERLALQQQVTQARQQESAVLAGILARADQLGLTEEERQRYAEGLAQSQHEVTLSQREQVKLQDEIAGEAREIVNLYGQLVKLAGSETGVAGAQRDLAEATTDLGDAYARALPYLEQFREGSLKPEDFTEAQEALGGLVQALEAQRQKLEALRSEYQRQRDALGSLQDVLRSFGQEFGDEGLLNSAISFNQTTYDQARDALRTLLLGGQYDAAQLAEATRNLQQSYGGLKDSVVALGEARAREHERERDRIKRESDARLRTLDAQIEAAKKAGLDTTALERERDTIVRDTERRVTELEGRAEAARKAAQDALSDRTKGLQELLRGVSGGAAAAGSQVDALGRQVQQSERDVQGSAEQMRKSLEGAFKGVPAQAGKAGADAGRQFMAQLQRQLKAVRLPGITTPGAPTLPATRPAVTNITQTITINGQNITGTSSQTMKQLLRGLQAEAEAECRRRNS